MLTYWSGGINRHDLGVTPGGFECLALIQQFVPRGVAVHCPLLQWLLATGLRATNPQRCERGCEGLRGELSGRQGLPSAGTARV